MKSDKQIKQEYRKVFWKHPEKYYPTTILKDEGFSRHICKVCKKPFWHVNADRTYCGDPVCVPHESFSFIGKSPAKKTLSYLQIWTTFSKMFENFGYASVNRYPIVARWNPTMEFTNSSIASFQPHVVSGEAAPPANPLVIPQFCFRTTDIDNVGITGAHNTVFNMIGQHQFVPEHEWDQNNVFHHIHHWLHKGLGLPHEEISFIEDSWAGGGNFGPCMEFFSRGCELGNQVYMTHEQTPSGVRKLDLKVLDMGMGMERNAWFSQGVGTIYDAAFPDVMKKLTTTTGLKVKKSVMKRYVPHAGLLNIDEVDDINTTWKSVARKAGVSMQELRGTVMPMAGLYSVAEHARALLVIFGDGGLPSNVGDGYNVRVLVRRALSFLDQYQWDIDLKDVMQWHARALKPVFPEFLEQLDNVHNILDNETNKYEATKQKSHQLIKSLVSGKKTISEKTLLQLYDSQGISPELIREEAAKMKKKVIVPDDFYKKVSVLHEKKHDKFASTKMEHINFGDVKSTKVRYYDDYKTTTFRSKVVAQKDKYVVLNETYFYPTSGGQLHDKGTIAGEKVVDVFKQGNVVVHVLSGKHTFPVGEEVEGVIDKERRIQLAQHHTTAHILNAAARMVLGGHVNQASAHKDIDKGRLDITHYKGLSPDEVRKIEQEANKIVGKKVAMKKSFVERGKAEKTFGVGIYQGGVVPGKDLRIVEIPGIDVEACGGTHLDNTAEAGEIKIIKTTKVSDSIVRIEYVSGNAAQETGEGHSHLVSEIASLLDVKKALIPGRAEEVFLLWKQIVKKKKDMPVKFISIKQEPLDDEELLRRTATILKTQPEHVVKTLKRFMKDLYNVKAQRAKDVQH